MTTEPPRARGYGGSRISLDPTTRAALVLFNPALNLDRQHARNDERYKGRALELSPCHHLQDSDLPPTLVRHGKADESVPFAESETFCRVAAARGYECELVGYDEAPHGFFNRGVQNGRWYTPRSSKRTRSLFSLAIYQDQRVEDPAPAALSATFCKAAPKQFLSRSATDRHAA